MPTVDNNVSFLVFLKRYHQQYVYCSSDLAESAVEYDPELV